MVRIIIDKEAQPLLKSYPSVGNFSFLEVHSYSPPQQSVHSFLHILIPWAFLEHLLVESPERARAKRGRAMFHSIFRFPKNKFFILLLL